MLSIPKTQIKLLAGFHFDFFKPHFEGGQAIHSSTAVHNM